MGNDMITGTITPDGDSQNNNPIPQKDMVLVTIKYPENFIGKRVLFDGMDYWVSPETAEIFRERGIIKTTAISKPSSSALPGEEGSSEQTSKPTKTKKK